MCVAVLLGAAAGRVESGVATLPGQTGQHLLLDLLPVAVLTLGGQQAAHRLWGRLAQLHNQPRDLSAVFNSASTTSADQTVNSVSFLY